MASATSARKRPIGDYHADLVALCSAQVTIEIVETDGSLGELIETARPAAFLVSSRDHRLGYEFRRSQTDRVIDAVGCPVLGAHTHDSDRQAIRRRVVERLGV